MTARVKQLTLLLAVLALALAACDTGKRPAPTPTPEPKYLTEEMPPCEPVPGSAMDPCEILPSRTAGAHQVVGSEPLRLSIYLNGWGSDVHVTHLVLRGTYLPGTVRCIDHGMLYRRPPYDSEWGGSRWNSIAVYCYADVRVSAYVLGTGPPILTVLVYYVDYWPEEEREYVEGLRSRLEQWLLEGGESNRMTVPEGGFEGREEILFVGPTVDASAETWEVYHRWDVQRREDGTVVAVHPHRDYWSYDEADYQAYRTRLEMELPAFTQAVISANQERVDEYGGRTAAGERYPMLVTDANRLPQFMIDIGAYDHPGGPPVAPPPSCGLAVSYQFDNPGLVRDCITLLAAKDMLRGTGSLNWGTGKILTDWDGVTASSDHSGVTKLLLSEDDLSGTIPPELGDLFELTHLDLRRNSLTGEIPRELGGLSNLVFIKLAGNSLTGCIPTALKDVNTNDLSSLNLQYCPPAPDALTTGTPGETSMPLSWSAVSNVTKYRVEYRQANSSHWTIDDEAITTTSHTVDGVICEAEYHYRVRAYGDGTTYASTWSDPSEVVSVKTWACVYPDFGAASYEFRVMEDVAVDAIVGSVSATDPGGGALEYQFLDGNEDGLFAIGETGGEITVAADLTGKAGTTVSLTAVAWSVRGGGRKVPVEVSIE